MAVVRGWLTAYREGERVKKKHFALKCVRVIEKWCRSTLWFFSAVVRTTRVYQTPSGSDSLARLLHNQSVHCVRSIYLVYIDQDLTYAKEVF